MEEVAALHWLCRTSEWADISQEFVETDHMRNVRDIIDVRTGNRRASYISGGLWSSTAIKQQWKPSEADASAKHAKCAAD